MHSVAIPEHLAQRIHAIAVDRTSGASAILTDAIAILREAAAEPATLAEAARALCRAQPSMASLWNAAIAATAEGPESSRLDAFAERAAGAPAAIARYAREHFLDTPDTPLRAVTVSSSGSVRSVLEAVAADRAVRAACAEGRPAYEGHTLAAELAASGVPVTLFADAGLGHALAGADVVIVGADAIAPEWFINKIGTAMLAAMALRQSVPVYVVATRHKFVGHELAALLPLDEGPSEEIWEDPPAGITVRNFYFERIPLDLVTAVITDDGIIGARTVPDVCAAAQDEAAIEALRVLSAEA